MNFKEKKTYFKALNNNRRVFRQISYRLRADGIVSKIYERDGIIRLNMTMGSHKATIIAETDTLIMGNIEKIGKKDGLLKVVLGRNASENELYESARSLFKTKIYGIKVEEKALVSIKFVGDREMLWLLPGARLGTEQEDLKEKTDIVVPYKSPETLAEMFMPLQVKSSRYYQEKHIEKAPLIPSIVWGKWMEKKYYCVKFAHIISDMCFTYDSGKSLHIYNAKPSREYHEDKKTSSQTP